MNKETYIRAVLESIFWGYKDELIDNAVNMIMSYCPTNGEVYKPTLTIWSCDRNICKQNEYRGIDCGECEITKHNKIVMDEVEE